MGAVASAFKSAVGIGESDKPKGSTVTQPPKTGPGVSQQPGQQFGPYKTGPGVTQGESLPQMEGMDFTKRGAGEQYFKDNSQVWQTPSYGELNTQGIVNQYTNPANRPQTTNNSQDWFEQYQGNMPSISAEPGLGAYYDNAKNRAAESIDQAAGARGNYGSSSAIDQNARAFTDLEGQRALHEADYNLRRLGEQRAWQGMGGDFARAADGTSLAQSQDEQNWANLLSQLGINASTLGLNRTNAGQDAANSAQGAQRNRGQDYFNNQASSGDRFADLMRSIMGPALDNDAALLDNSVSGGIAQGNQAASNEAQNAQNTLEYGKTGLSLYDKYSQ